MRHFRDYIAAGDPGASKNVLKRLSRHSSSNVRQRVAENPSAPADVLEMLACDEDPEVRGALSYNPSVSIFIVERLGRDPSPDVRLVLAESTTLPERILRMLMADENPYVSDRASRTMAIKTLESMLEEEGFESRSGEVARLGELLTRAGFLAPEELEMLLPHTSCRKPLGHVILECTDCQPASLAMALKLQMEVRQGELTVPEAVRQLAGLCTESRKDAPARRLAESA
ncbi:MAG: hypothetical protein AB7W16_14795 [Candidatus Obscuribacterales bacterium]